MFTQDRLGEVRHHGVREPLQDDHAVSLAPHGMRARKKESRHEPLRRIPRKCPVAHGMLRHLTPTSQRLFRTPRPCGIKSPPGQYIEKVMGILLGATPDIQAVRALGAGPCREMKSEEAQRWDRAPMLAKLVIKKPRRGRKSRQDEE